MNKSNNNSGGAKRKAQYPPPSQPQPKKQRVEPPAQRSEGQARKPFDQRRPRGGAGPLIGVSAAYASAQRSGAPRIQASRDQCRIVHRELVASVTGSVAFTIAQSIALNPGMAASFPWLASQAQNWERYRFNKLKFCYYTRTGSNVPGSVQMIPDYDAADAAPSSEQIASAYEDVEEDAPWKDISCDLKPSSLHALGPTKFIRSAALAANLDIKTYDAGNFFLATVDGTAVNWGKLWVEYDVSLYSPQLPSGGNPSAAAFAALSTTPTTANMLNAQAPVANSTPLVTVAGEVVTFNEAGQFVIDYLVQGTTCTVTGNPVVAAGGTNLFLTSAGSGTAALIQVIQLSAVVGTTVTFNNTLVAGTGAQMLVARLPSQLGNL